MSRYSGQVELDSVLSRRADMLIEYADNYRDEDRFGPITNDFFRRYRRISKKNGSLSVGYDLISDSEYFDGYISVGNYEYWEILVGIADDRVYVVDGSEETIDSTDAIYPDIFSYLVSDLNG